MTKESFENIFYNLTRLIFTVITAESAVFLSMVTVPLESFEQYCIYRNLPLCGEYMIAGVILYLVCAVAASAAVRNYHT